MDSFGALVFTRIQPETCLGRCFALCSLASLLAAAVSAVSPASCREKNPFHPRQQVIHLSTRLLASPRHPTGSVDSARLGVSPASSKVNLWVAASSREHEKCCNSLRAITGEDAKECAQHWIALCWGRGGVYKKKTSLDESLCLKQEGKEALEYRRM